MQSVSREVAADGVALTQRYVDAKAQSILTSELRSLNVNLPFSEHIRRARISSANDTIVEAV